MSFGHICAIQIITQKEALQADSGSHISGHGGTNRRIIGAAAAVGLTAYGWSGRFIEFAGLHSFPDMGWHKNDCCKDYSFVFIFTRMLLQHSAFLISKWSVLSII